MTTDIDVPDPADFLAVGGLLDDEERAVRDRVRDYARTELAPQVSDRYESGAIPTAELAAGFARLGLLGMHLQGCRCPGASAVAYGLACRELEAVDSGLRSFVSVQGSLAMFALHRWGSADQKNDWLPRMAASEALGCFALTEPDAGSDPASMGTTARRAGGDWVLDGAKRWSSNGTVADVAVVWADTEEGVRGFVVLTDTPGFIANPQALPARLGERRACLRQPATARVGRPTGGERPQGAPELPRRGALRNPLGRSRGGSRLLRGSAGLHRGA